jgi:hypothetical protein
MVTVLVRPYDLRQTGCQLVEAAQEICFILLTPQPPINQGLNRNASKTMIYLLIPLIPLVNQGGPE